MGGHLLKFQRKIFESALRPPAKEPVRPIREKIELLKRLFTMEEIQNLYVDLWKASDALAFYCYVRDDQVLASCHILRHDYTRAYPFVRWDYKDQTKIWNRKKEDWIFEKKGHHVHPFNIVQIEDLSVSDQDEGIAENFLKELLVLLNFQSKTLYIYANADNDDISTVKSYTNLFGYEGEDLPVYAKMNIIPDAGIRYWIVQ